jgi:hypothetical protein
VSGSDPLASARQRAFALADTGDYLLWHNIARVLAHEGFAVDAIKKLGKDRVAQRELTARIHAADKSHARPPDETRMTRWRRIG